MKLLKSRSLLIAAVGVVGMALLASDARAQTRPIVIRQFPSAQQFYVNPNPYIAPGLTLRQWAYNQSVVNRVYARTPPWFYGYNPYPQVVNYGPVYRYPAYVPPVYPPYYPPVYPRPLDPYAAYNPYAGYSNPASIYGLPY